MNIGRSRLAVYVLVSVLVVGTAGLVSPSLARAVSLHEWYANEHLVSAEGNVWSDSQGAIPTDHTYCFAYGMGVKQMNLGVPWSVADFTELSVPQPYGAYQRGIDEGWYGSNACQTYGRAMGFQLHKDSIIDDNPGAATGHIYGMQMIRNWGTDLSRRPWAGFGNGAALRLQASYTVPRRYTPPGVVQYGQLVASLVDTTHPGPNKAFFYSISLWDSRGPQGEWVHADTGGTPNYVVNTYAGASRFSSLHADSQNAYGTGTCGCLWYGVYITRQNLINAVNAINQQGQHFSTDPNNYAINLVASGTEMYSPLGALGWVGSRTWDLMALTEY